MSIIKIEFYSNFIMKGVNNMNNNLKKIRIEKNLKQKELAKLLNLDHSQISKIETGKSDLTGKIIKKICQLFNVSADYLLGLNEKNKIGG